MKHSIRTLMAMTALLFIVSACGQKGPLIIERPATATTPAGPQEVTDEDSALNTQTEKTSSTR